MRIGIPKEIKDHEYRVGITPGEVKTLVDSGHEILVEKGAGHAIGFSDADYAKWGAIIAQYPADIYSCPMILKVKEPQESEYPFLKEDSILFCYLHLAANPALAKVLLERNVTAIGFETVTDKHGNLPLLEPMSRIAGRLSVQAGANCLTMIQGGSGVLLGGVPGVSPARVTILGGGTVGSSAAILAHHMGADVTVFDISTEVLERLEALELKTAYSEKEFLEKSVIDSDLVIGATAVPGRKAPKLMSRDIVRQMKKGAVLVDVAIDQGGCAETSRPTTHTSPTYVEEGVVHYCVTNMPSAVAKTSTLALCHATLPYAAKLANSGLSKALSDDEGLKSGLQIHDGAVTHVGVSEALGISYFL